MQAHVKVAGLVVSGVLLLPAGAMAQSYPAPPSYPVPTTPPTPSATPSQLSAFAALKALGGASIRISGLNITNGVDTYVRRTKIAGSRLTVTSRGALPTLAIVGRRNSTIRVRVSFRLSTKRGNRTRRVNLKGVSTTVRQYQTRVIRRSLNKANRSAVRRASRSDLRITVRVGNSTKVRNLRLRIRN